MLFGVPPFSGRSLDALRNEARIGRDRLQDVLPSVSAIKLVEIVPGRFVSFEGNGRLAALRAGLPVSVAALLPLAKLTGTTCCAAAGTASTSPAAAKAVMLVLHKKP